MTVSDKAKGGVIGFTCDGCGAKLGSDVKAVDPAKDAAKAAEADRAADVVLRDAGWKARWDPEGSKHACPKCAAAGRV